MRNETEVADETSQNATCTNANAFENGCKKMVTDYLDVVFHPLTVGVIVVLMIQVREYSLNHLIMHVNNLILTLQIMFFFNS